MIKKFALAVTAAAAVVLGSAGVADAGVYPPNGKTVTVQDSTVPPGGPVSVTTNCTVGETVTFVLEGSSDTETCTPSTDGGNNFTAAVAGTATGTVNAPTTPGTYIGTVTGSISGALGTFTVVVEGATATTAAPTSTGSLPATGSDGTSTMTLIAGGLLIVGLGMFGVATARRRQDTAAA